MAAVPNATLVGFSGTPIDKTAYGRGTFKTFGCEDDKGYLHKYSIAESIQDGTTLPLYYNVAPNEMLVPHELLDKEFLSLVETEGIADIEELNAVLERAVNLKNFLKGDNRVKEVARFVADHYRSNVEPLGYKAFLVAVDRPACHKYKAALDTILPPEYSAVIMTTNNNDGPELKQYHLDDKSEKAIRKNFRKFGEFPKVLIVTEKLLTGYDAPILYSMYLDKPMRDHTLLQAIARVNRPYENEQQEMVKPHGFVLDFIGIFENLEKALQFDSEEINAIVKDLSLLKHVFKAKMESVAPEYLQLIHFNFDDRDNDNLIEHFRDKERRKQFFKEYKEIEMLYEIVSPDAFLRPYLEDYATLSGIYAVVRKAFSRGAQPDKEFQRKTNALVQAHIATGIIQPVRDIFAIDEKTIEAIQSRDGGDNAKVINLIKSIEKTAEEQSEDPYFIAMADRARAVQESFEDRQTDTAEALSALFEEIERNEKRKRLQVESGLDALTYYVLCKLTEEQIPNARSMSEKIAAAFRESVNWRRSEKELRELRNQITFAIYGEVDDLDRVASLVDSLFDVLLKAGNPHAEIRQ
jgi:type I restriction enzyme R subunit